MYSSGIADSERGISRMSERRRGRAVARGTLFSGMMPGNALIRNMSAHIDPVEVAL